MTKKEIDRLGEALREGKRDEATLVALNDLYRQYEPTASKVHEVLLSTIQDLGLLDPTIAPRPTKSIGSIVAKLLRQQQAHLSSMQDIIGCRIVVENRVDQKTLLDTLYFAPERLAALREWFGSIGILDPQNRPFRDARIFDRNESPSHGYRAIHLVVRDFGPPYEIQIRTRLQNRWAQLSERLDDKYPLVKYGKGPPSVRQALDTLSNETDSIERELAKATEDEEGSEMDYRIVQRRWERIHEDIATLNRLYDAVEEKYELP